MQHSHQRIENMASRYIKKILEANVYDVAQETPLESAAMLTDRLRNQVFLKREDLQQIFSFKLRGAYNKIVHLSDQQKRQGIITASAGNHAQGVALAARQLGIKASIVMGRNTPEIKVKAVEAYGANIILHGDSYDEAADCARELAGKKGYTYIHPFDDPDVIAGQGTIGMEIMRQLPNVDVVFVPVGGGGLIAGVSAFIKYLRPATRIIGVESEGSACMTAAFNKGRRVALSPDDLDLFADGTSVTQVGKEAFRIAHKCVDEMVTVNTDEICAAIKDVFEDTRSIAEPSGALSVAGMKKYLEAHSLRHQKLVAVISGANVNFDRLRHISERTEIGEKREALLSVTIPERPGSFKIFCGAIGKRNITEFNYRYRDREQAQVFAGVQLSEDHSDRQDLLTALEEKDYPVVDLTDNELAALHVRHMVGGRAPEIDNELAYRFEFPERPGALLKFLTVLGNRWNISMFHYRNHGAAFGRVLVGIQVPKEDKQRFKGFLDKIGYRFWEETDNPAYRLFLA
jgi:threonine dehydratase